MELDPFFAVTDATDNMKPKINKSEVEKASVQKKVEHNNGKPEQLNCDKNSAQNNKSNDSDLISNANAEISFLLQENKINQDEVASLQSILHENIALKEKTNKLKSLLARSAKAQNELKADLSTTKLKLEQAHVSIEKMNEKLERVANRTTHMDVLADFETNFDRALMSFNTTNEDGDLTVEEFDRDEEYQNQYQVGGENSSPHAMAQLSSNYSSVKNNEPIMSDQNALLAELNTAQTRAQHLESLNNTLHQRSSKLEEENIRMSAELSQAHSQISNIELELQLAKMEASRMTSKIKEKAIALSEMQMEIDLVTKASMDANARASESMEVVKNIKTDKRHVDELEAKVDALQEWALASAEAKRLTVERAKELEKKLAIFQEMMEGEDESDQKNGGNGSTSSDGRKLWTKNSSKVVGAGMVGSFVVELGDHKLSENEIILLKWKFDIIPGDLDIDFSILKGICADANNRQGADYLIHNRTVIGGAGGEVSGAFAVQNACTLIWSNVRSWVRPRAIKFTVEAFATQM